MNLVYRMIGFFSGLRRIGKNRPASPRVVMTESELVSDPLPLNSEELPGPAPVPAESFVEVDFSRHSDLEAYASELHVPQESIQQMISAGLLFPQEIRVAEDLLRILRKRGLDRAA